MSRRPRKLPARFQDYEVSLPGRRRPEEERPTAVAVKQEDKDQALFDALLGKMQSDLQRASDLMLKRGSRTLLRRVTHRMGETLKEFNAQCHQMVNAATGREQMETIIETNTRVRRIAEDMEDNVIEHLDSRRQESATVDLGSVGSLRSFLDGSFLTSSDVSVDISGEAVVEMSGDLQASLSSTEAFGTPSSGVAGLQRPKPENIQEHTREEVVYEPEKAAAPQHADQEQAVKDESVDVAEDNTIDELGITQSTRIKKETSQPSKSGKPSVKSDQESIKKEISQPSKSGKPSVKSDQSPVVSRAHQRSADASVARGGCESLQSTEVQRLQEVEMAYKAAVSSRISRESASKENRVVTQIPDKPPVVTSPLSSDVCVVSKRHSTPKQFSDVFQGHTPLLSLLKSRKEEEEVEEIDPEEERRQLQRFFQGMTKPKLRKFSGDDDDYEDWRHQFDLFVDSAKIPTRHKMAMLKSSVEGKPQKLVANLGYTDRQYSLALAKLDSRYGGSRRMLYRDVEKLESIQNVKNSDVFSLEEFSNQLSNILVRMVDNDRERELMGDSILFNMVLQKVPEQLTMRYYDSFPEDDGLASFADWLASYVNKRLELYEMRLGKQESTSKSSAQAEKPHKEKPPRRKPEKKTSAQSHSATVSPSTSEKVADLEKSAWLKLTVHDRWEVAKANGLCYRCLEKSHLAKDCHKVRKCGIDGCERTHHPDLHYKKKPDQTEKPSTKSNSAFGVRKDGVVQTQSIALRIIPVMVADGNGVKRRVNALLDDGSDSSYISQEIVNALKLPVEKNPLRLSTLMSSKKVDSGLAVVDIESVDGTLSRKIGVRTLERLCPNLRVPDWQREKAKWPHLRKIDFPSVEIRGVVDLLIGSDHPELMLALEERYGQIGDPVARLTPLGWTCVGALDDLASGGTAFNSTAYSYHTLSDHQIDESLKALWNMDVLTPVDVPRVLTAEEDQALQKAMSSKKYHGDRYEIGIPWVDERPQLPDNFREAERRLQSLEKSLEKKPELKEKYKEEMQKNIEKGYIALVDGSRDEIPSGWYLPHFPVVREDKTTTKCRIVLDSASKYQGVSLNDVMLPGPKLQREIFDILVRFREQKVGIVADIKEMFPQVILAEEDRRFHRVLWRDLDPASPIRIYEAQRLTFGDKASPFLAQYILQSHATDHADRFPRAAETCLTATYMDDAIDRVDSTNDGICLFQDLVELGAGAGYQFHKFCSNDPEVLRNLPADRLAPGILELRDSELPNIKTLGLLWDASEDCFLFTSHIKPPVTFTKRTLLSRVAMLFDPLQLLAPFTIKAKMLLQKTWILGLDWDQVLPPDLIEAAKSWFEELSGISSVSVPRCYFPGAVDEVSLHTFSDASNAAYAAVVYVRSVSLDNVEIQKVAAKARVSPLKAISIPRLELMGAVLGYRLSKKICTLLGYSLRKVTFWTDSMDVIHWVRSQSRNYKAFVANRVSELQDDSLPNQWRHVPGKENPADDATRGLLLNQMTVEHRWFAGPDFLYKDEDEWPKTKVTATSEAAEVEVAKSRSHVAATEATAEQESKFMRWEKFSSWVRLVRTCVMVLRFIRLLRTPKERRPQSGSSKIVDLKEFTKAELLVVRCVQEEGLRTALTSLKSGDGVGGPLRRLTPFLDCDGIMRVGGRLQLSGLAYDIQHPMILPAKHHVTELVIRRAHEKVGHSRGIGAIMSELQQRFWIIHGREAIKKLKYSCYQCRKRNEVCSEQIMAPLPSSRVLTSLRAFANLGIDFAGPFTTKITRRVSAKRYVCLFTCAQTRGVHLELVYSLETEGFLQAFSRMVSRRGSPEKVVCDNGSNLSAGERYLKELVTVLDQDRIVEAAAQHSIEWSFNPPYGSHHGGLFESLIKSTKRGLYAILSNAGITDEELHTALTEVEGMLNSRPLLYCSSDPDDEPVLTPNHFLIGQMGGPLAPYGTEELAYNPRQRWRFVQDLVGRFWRRWTKEYLPSLQSRGKWLTEKRDLVIDDVVLVSDPKSPRGMWPLGRITQTFPGPDGHVRTVEILSRGKRYIRPITKLALIVARDETKQDAIPETVS